MPRSILATATAALFLAAALCAGTVAAQARGISRGGEVSFRLESPGGAVLPTYEHRGYNWVEGRRGQRYVIRVFNRTSERIEAVVTVDGRDVITGRPGNYHRNRGYVIQPHGSVRIEGFRRSWSEVAAFRFTDVPDSYAARMGDASNVGVIGVAVFKERHRRPVPRPAPIATDEPRRDGAAQGSGYGRGGGGGARAPESEAAPSAGPRARFGGTGIGTGYGEDSWSPASRTTFERRTRGPQARLALYYDDRDGLVARGVIPRPWSPPPHPYEPRPFPESPEPGFAPPPPPIGFHWE